MAILVIILELAHKIMLLVHPVLELMFRIVAGIAIIATMCVLSPVRESKRDSDQPRSWPPPSLSASLDVLTGAAATGAASRVIEPIGREAASAMAAPAARAALAGGAETVRRIVIPPPTAPIDMPPLRR